jgi:taurine transport system substrate-binding protein
MKKLGHRAAVVGGILLVALTGCVETGRDSSPAPAGGAAAAGCPWPADPSVQTAVRIAWQASPTGDLVVKDKGLLEACMPNADITWSQFSSGADVIQAFGANSADIGLIGSSPATIAVSQPLQLPIKVVWIQEVIGTAESLVARDPAVTAVADLAGKRVAVPFSSTAHFSLLQALGGAGLVAGQDVELINLAPDAMLPAWSGGQIDAAWVWNPVLGELSKTGKPIYSSADTAAAGKPTYDLSAATTGFVEANPAFMVQWARAQDHAVALIKDDPAEASESIAIQMGISPNEAGDQLSGYIYLRAGEQSGPEWLGGKLGTDLITTAGFLLEQGSIDGVSPEQAYRDAVDAGPAASVE